MKYFSFALLFVVVVQLLCAEETSLRFDFADTEKFPQGWQQHGKLPGIPRTDFTIGRESTAQNGRVLAIRAKKSSGVLMTRVPKKVWEKNPVMHWRWRILRKINLDSGKKEPDDQAAVLYWGDGTLLMQKTVAYRWEHHTGVNTERMLVYRGITKVQSTCVQNKKAPAGVWLEEYRNVVKDYAKAFGRPPKGECILSIGANSQYTQSDTLVEIDFIEFIPRKEKKEKAK